MTEKDLIANLESLRSIMISVSTGGPSINIKNDEYKILYGDVDVELRTRGIENPNPYLDLWDWHARWSSGDMPTYQSRRAFLSSIFNPIIKQVRDISIGVHRDVEKPTGWSRVDRTVGEMRRRLMEADSEEELQAIGLLCREALISLAQAVYVASRHPTLDGTNPSKTDAKRMLEAYIAIELGGRSNEVVRKHARASIDLAVELQHSRTAEYQEAALCVEATLSVINVVAILSGRRHPTV